MNSKLRFPIPSDILENTIEYSREFSLRLQIEAVALAGLDSPQAKALAQERLEQAAQVWAMFEHYISL
ncbi:MAG: hypothetical protein HFF49_10795 [Lawsonibacter sp.]|jgi:hypothetical protein|nr:hypothetical protein [Lawsonibacter sp.]